MGAIFIASTVALLASIISSGTALSIQVNPDVYTEKSPRSVNITCSLDVIDAGVKTILVLEVVNKGGQPIAILQQTGLTFGSGYYLPEKFQSEGLLDTNVSNSFLRLSIQDPDDADAGQYSCKMFFMDTNNFMTEHGASHNLTIDSLDLNSVVRELRDDVSALKQKNTDLETKLMDEISKDSFTSAFSASLNTNVMNKDGDILIFPDVVMKIGDGYDVTTGLFTAPRHGLYVFHLTLRNVPECCKGIFHLNVNNINVAGMDLSEEQNNEETKQSSVSTVAELAMGDRVKVLVGNHMQLSGDYRYCSFTGYLIRAY